MLAKPRIEQITLDQMHRASTYRLEAMRELLGFALRRAIVQHDAGASCVQAPCDGGTDTTRGTGDEYDLLRHGHVVGDNSSDRLVDFTRMAHHHPMSGLPPPTPEALAHSERLHELICSDIAANGGWIPFSRYMELALYAPGLGYYSAGARKLGAAGDFTTAPEMTPLFGQTLARPLAQLIMSGLPDLLEVGAGSGALAASLLEELERLDALPASYQILEVSADLRERERDTLARRVPHLLDRVQWLNGLPPGFEGVVIGNEVLDAMPVELLQWRADGAPLRGGVTVTQGEFGTHGERVTQAANATCVNDEVRGAHGTLLSEFRAFDKSAQPALDEAIAQLARRGLPGALNAPYTSEIGLAASGFLRSLIGSVTRGVFLFIDYGFAAAEFYHPQRSEGTLICHYQHRSHDQVLLWPGLQDITAHVDFSAIAQTARAAGCILLGYTSQAHFLINCGITDLLAQTPAQDALRYLPQSNAVQRLLSPTEMGELFKVIGFARNWHGTLSGFARGDRGGALD